MEWKKPKKKNKKLSIVRMRGIKRAITTMEATWPTIDTCYIENKLARTLCVDKHEHIDAHSRNFIQKSIYVYKAIWGHHCKHFVSKTKEEMRERRNCVYVFLFFLSRNAYNAQIPTHQNTSSLLLFISSYQFLCQILVCMLKENRKYCLFRECLCLEKKTQTTGKCFYWW